MGWCGGDTPVNRGGAPRVASPCRSTTTALGGHARLPEETRASDTTMSSAGVGARRGVSLSLAVRASPEEGQRSSKASRSRSRQREGAEGDTANHAEAPSKGGLAAAAALGLGKGGGTGGAAGGSKWGAMRKATRAMGTVNRIAKAAGITPALALLDASHTPSATELDAFFNDVDPARELAEEEAKEKARDSGAHQNVAAVVAWLKANCAPAGGGVPVTPTMGTRAEKSFEAEEPDDAKDDADGGEGKDDASAKAEEAADEATAQPSAATTAMVAAAAARLRYRGARKLKLDLRGAPAFVTKDAKTFATAIRKWRTARRIVDLTAAASDLGSLGKGLKLLNRLERLCISEQSSKLQRVLQRVRASRKSKVGEKKTIVVGGVKIEVPGGQDNGTGGMLKALGLPADKDSGSDVERTPSDTDGSPVLSINYSSPAVSSADEADAPPEKMTADGIVLFEIASLLRFLIEKPLKRLQTLIINNWKIPEGAVHVLGRFILTHSETLVVVDLTNARLSGESLDELATVLARRDVRASTLRMIKIVGCGTYDERIEFYKRWYQAFIVEEERRQSDPHPMSDTESEASSVTSSSRGRAAREAAQKAAEAAAAARRALPTKENHLKVLRISNFQDPTPEEARGFFSLCNEVSSVSVHRSNFELLLTPLSDALTENKTVVALDLQNNGLGDDGAMLLAESLRHNVALRKLKLVDGTVTKLGARAFTKMLQESRTSALERITLARPDTDLEYVLSVRKNLVAKTAKIFADPKRDVRMALVAPMIRANIDLESLDLSGNRLTIKDVRMLVGALDANKERKRLTKLGLAKTGFSDEGCEVLAELMCQHASLANVDLQSNAITDAGAQVFVRKRGMVKLIRLGGNSVSNEMMNKIWSAAKDKMDKINAAGSSTVISVADTASTDVWPEVGCVLAAEFGVSITILPGEMRVREHVDEELRGAAAADVDAIGGDKESGVAVIKRDGSFTGKRTLKVIRERKAGVRTLRVSSVSVAGRANLPELPLGYVYAGSFGGAFEISPYTLQFKSGSSGLHVRVRHNLSSAETAPMIAEGVRVLFLPAADDPDAKDSASSEFSPGHVSPSKKADELGQRTAWSGIEWEECRSNLAYRGNHIEFTTQRAGYFALVWNKNVGPTPCAARCFTFCPAFGASPVTDRFLPVVAAVVPVFAVPSECPESAFDEAERVAALLKRVRHMGGVKHKYTCNGVSGVLAMCRGAEGSITIGKTRRILGAWERRLLVTDEVCWPASRDMSPL